MSDKVRENRLRRMAERQGLQLQKSRRRDPRATDYGKYALVSTDRVRRSGIQFDLSLDDVEAFLMGETV